MRKNVLLLVASLGVFALATELLFRLLFEAPAEWKEPQTRHLRSPLLGWVLPPSTESFTIDAPVRVNALGLRDDELPLDKPPGQIRILVLGDSFTFALGVRFEDLYAQQLERRLQDLTGATRVQVINAGVAGYNTRQELIYLLSDGLRLEPDLVIVGFYWNDLVGNAEPLPDPSTPRLAEDAGLYEPGRRRHTLPAPIRDALRKSVLLYQVVTRTQQLAGLARPRTDEYARVQSALLAGDAGVLAPYWESTRRRLVEISDACWVRGVPVILVAFPDENQVRRGHPQNGIGPALEAIWEGTRMPFVDLEPAYRRALARGENPYLPYDLHPNALGMRLAADALKAAILSNGLLANRPVP